MKLYVSGPMRNIAQFNFPAFDAARDYLNWLGHEVFSPADNDRAVWPECEQAPGFAEGTSYSGDVAPIGYSFHKLFVWDVQSLSDADGIVLLPGWERSEGAALELHVARAFRLRTFHLVTKGSGIGQPWIENGELSLVELPKPVIVGLSGYAQTGKDTAALTFGALGFTRLAFADALREALYVLNPSIKVKGNWTKLQTHVQRVGWEEAKRLDGVRRLLQRMGTDVARNIIADDAWTAIMQRRIEASYTGFDETPEAARYVITDVRFPNEAKLINDLGGEVWRIEREGYGPINNHPSETALDDWSFDARIANDGADLTLYTNVIAETACLRGLLDDATTERLLEFFAIAEPDRATQSS